MVKVSVIVPVYNVYDYLDKCLDSLYKQTLKEIEFIIVNDGTLDNSEEIINKYVNLDKRFKYYKKVNGGLSDARNYGYKYASGEYIAFLDSDDYVEYDMYEAMYKKAISDNYDLVECDFYWVYDKKKTLDRSSIKDNYFVDIRVVAWNKLYKKSILDKHNLLFAKGLQYEDICYCYKLLPHIKKIGYVDRGLYYYIQRNSSIANTSNKRVREIYDILQLVLDYYKDNNIFDTYYSELEYATMKFILGRSFYRISMLSDKTMRRKYLDEGWDFLNNNFPRFKKNKYLKKKKGLKNRYYRLLNRSLYNFSSWIFRHFGSVILKIVNG